MPAFHKKAIADIVSCRTPAQGGQLYFCYSCDQFCYSYHSCKSRFCPKCQNEQGNLWLQKQNHLLLPINYFLVTLTLPQEFRHLARSNQKLFYNILMRAAAAALQTVASNQKFLGASPGIVSVLQTWTRDMRYHPHVHMIVSGGGICQKTNRWISCRHDYLMPQEALAKVFRAKFRDALKKVSPSFSVPRHVWKTDWVVDIRNVGSGELALRYLAPYIFRVAISNRRILKLENGLVTFQFKDSKTKTVQLAVLPAERFIQRFLQHVLPTGFQKVRYYGLFHPKRKSLLGRAKKLLGTDTEHQSEASIQQISKTLHCPECGSPLKLLGTLPRQKPLKQVRSP